MSVPSQATQVVLSERPEGPITPTTFTVKSAPIPSELAPGDVLVRVDWLSLDPAMRGWIRDTRSYVPPVQIGEKMRSQGLGTVIKGGGSKVKVGDTVRGVVGMWTVLFENPPRLIHGQKDGPTMQLLKKKISIRSRARQLAVIFRLFPNMSFISPPEGTSELDYLSTLGMPGELNLLITCVC
jgi:N-terminal domain of oxidoreductase